MSSANSARCQCFPDVQGFENRRNDIIYCPPHSPDPGTSSETQNHDVVVYFGGDIQDYRDRMEKHRDNRRYASERNLELTAASLSKKFPHSSIFIIKPYRMYLGSFACYSNFLLCNDIGAPISNPPSDRSAWEHLKLLLDRIGGLILPQKDLSTSNVTLIGFSKGAVVLNQLVYEMKMAEEKSTEKSAPEKSTTNSMIDRVRAWYWLDGAHAGSKKTWITDLETLDVMANRAQKNRVRVYAHVTPRQVRDPGRPWVGEEEAKFSHALERRLGDLFMRKLHFEDEPPSLEQHFRVLDVFEPDRVG